MVEDEDGVDGAAACTSGQTCDEISGMNVNEMIGTHLPAGSIPS